MPQAYNLIKAHPGNITDVANIAKYVGKGQSQMTETVFKFIMRVMAG
jgi:hypothetical protein